jgi:GSH-dependent disulfide-bond oxidoreductase
MTDTSEYEPPKVEPGKASETVRNINRPIPGPTHEKQLPVNCHPLQLYSSAH